MDKNNDTVVFDEKFQINTIFEINEETGVLAKGKISKMSIQLDKSLGGTHLAESDFDMSDLFYGEYKPLRLYLKQSEDNRNYHINKDSYIDIGIKASNEDNMVQKRMLAIKNKMSNAIEQVMKD